MHDARGMSLTLGDLVFIPCRITELNPTDDYCNVTLETELGRRPDDASEKIYAINTGVLIRANNMTDMFALDS